MQTHQNIWSYTIFIIFFNFLGSSFLSELSRIEEYCICTGSPVTLLNTMLRRNHKEILTLQRWLAITAVVLCTRQPVLAQESLSARHTSFGLYGTLGGNYSLTNINEFAGNEFCGTFRKGTAQGVGFGLQLDLPVGSGFSFTPVIEFSDLSSRFTTEPFVLEHAFDLVTNDTFRISRHREYDVALHTLKLQLGGGYRITNNLLITTGIAAGLFVKNSYTKREKILTPDVVYAVNNLSTFELSSGAFDVPAVHLSLDGSLRYLIALMPNISVQPMIALSLPLTPMTTTENYRTIRFSGGVGITYRLPSPEPPIEILPLPLPEPIPQPIADREPPRSLLRAVVRAVGVSENGEEIREPVVAIENVRVTDVAPTLQYVFFDDGSPVIPLRYRTFTREKTTQFDPSDLHHRSALEIHYEVLNILGKRLRDNPDIRITITGTRSIRSAGDSLSSENISLLRAQNVAGYLQDVWDISSSRIRIKSRALPEQPSDESTSTGQAENRRVEITSNSAKLFAPVETRWVERTATPPRIAFYPDIESDTGITQLEIVIRQGDRILERIDALNDVRKKEQLWTIPSNTIESGVDDSLIWEMRIADSAGRTASVSGAIKLRLAEKLTELGVRDTVADRSVERFQLLLFDYSKASALSDAGINTLIDRISRSVSQDARIYLTGYTDVTGDPQYNERLSLERASSASLLLSSRLKQLGIRTPQFTLEGRGAKELLYDNTNAEGRFLSRTVRISIEKDLR